MRVLDSGPEWLSAAQSTDWVGSLKPWQLFVGIGEAAPFSLPSPSSVRQRVTHNAGVFLSNYALVSVLVCLLIALTHPFATAIVSLACVLGVKLAHHVWSSAFSLQLGSYRLGPPEIAGLVLASLFCSVIATFGTIIFTFIGIATTIVVAHAGLRQVEGAEAAMADAARDRDHADSLDLAEAGASEHVTDSPMEDREGGSTRSRHKAEPLSDSAKEH